MERREKPTPPPEQKVEGQNPTVQNPGPCRSPSVDAMDLGGVVTVDPDVGTTTELKGVDGNINSG